MYSSLFYFIFLIGKKTCIKRRLFHFRPEKYAQTTENKTNIYIYIYIYKIYVCMYVQEERESKNSRMDSLEINPHA